MPLTTPISGGTSVRTGLTVTLTNATAGGTWSSSDTAVATVVAGTGVVTGVAVGSCTIIYTVGADSIAEAFSVYYTTITNGWDATRIFPAFQGRLGWHQPSASSFPTLSNANKLATSGRYYDRGFHKGCTVNNYYETQENAAITTNEFNQLLQDEDQAVILELLNAVMNKPQLIEHKVDYTRVAYRQSIVIPNSGLAVGYRINIAPGDYAANIDSIGMLFDGVVTFNMYLFNDLILAPVQSQSVTTIANSQVRVSLDWVINYVNSSTSGGNMGGVWYLMYFQDDLGDIHAIDEQLNMWSDTKILGAIPFQSAKVGSLDFNRTNVSANFRTYGFNFEVSCYRDYTQKIIQNASLFDEARGLTMAIHVIEQILFSPRTNGNQRVMQEIANRLSPSMNMDSGEFNKNPYVADIKQRLAMQLKRLNEVFSPKPVPMSVNIGGVGNYWDYQYEGFDIRDMPSRQEAYGPYP